MSIPPPPGEKKFRPFTHSPWSWLTEPGAFVEVLWRGASVRTISMQACGCTELGLWVPVRAEEHSRADQHQLRVVNQHRRLTAPLNALDFDGRWAIVPASLFARGNDE